MPAGLFLCQGGKIKEKKKTTKKTEVKKQVIITGKSTTSADRNFTKSSNNLNQTLPQFSKGKSKIYLKGLKTMFYYIT